MDFQKLGRLADILDEAAKGYSATITYDVARRKTIGYVQSLWFHDKTCGTPACALGHWAAANQDRWKSYGGIPRLLAHCTDTSLNCAMVEFGISAEQAMRLFGTHGCDNARTATEAAAYIRRFMRTNGFVPAPERVPEPVAVKAPEIVPVGEIPAPVQPMELENGSPGDLPDISWGHSQELLGVER